MTLRARALPKGMAYPVERPLLLLLVTALGLCFGFQYAMARSIGLAEADPVGALFVIHLGLATGFVALLVAARHTFALRPSHVAYFLVVSLFANVGQLGVELIVARHVSAGQLTLVVSLLPLFVLMLGGLLGRETIGGRKAAALLFGCCSSSALLLPDALARPSEALWVALAFAAPASQAVGLLIMARFWPRGLDPLQVATGNLLAGTAVLAPAAYFASPFMGFAAPAAAGGSALFGFALTVAGEFLLYAMLTRRGGALLASCADFVGVAAGLGFGYLLFAEQPSAWMVVAALLCLPSLYLVTGREAEGGSAVRIA